MLAQLLVAAAAALTTELSKLIDWIMPGAATPQVIDWDGFAELEMVTLACVALRAVTISPLRQPPGRHLRHLLRRRRRQWRRPGLLQLALPRPQARCFSTKCSRCALVMLLSSKAYPCGTTLAHHPSNGHPDSV